MPLELITDTAYLLKKKPSGESSVIAHLFTKNHGKLIAVAKGIKQPKSKNYNHLQLFSEISISFNYKSDRPYQFLTQAELTDLRLNIPKDIRRSLLAMIHLEIIDKTQQNHADPDVYDLLTQSFAAINNSELAFPEIFHWRFIMRFLELSGLGLNLEVCSRCSASVKEGYIIPQNGQIICSECGHGLGSSFFIHPQEFYVLQNLALGRKIDLTGFEYMIPIIHQHLWNILAIHFEQLYHMNSVKALGTIL